MQAGSIEGDISLNAKSGQDAIRSIMSETKAMKNSVDQSLNGVRNSMKQSAAASEASWKDSLRSIKQEASAIGNVTKLMMGGGAVVGLTMAGSQLKNFADEANRLKSEFQSGAISAGELTEKIAGSLPVLGQFWQAGRSIRELFTGEQAEIARINEEARLTTQLFDAQLASVKALKSVLADISLRKAGYENILANVGADSFTKELNNLAFSEMVRQNEEPKKLAEELKRVTDEQQKAIDAQQKLVEQAKQQFTKRASGAWRSTNYREILEEGKGRREYPGRSKDLVLEDAKAVQEAHNQLVSLQQRLNKDKDAIKAAHAEANKAAELAADATKGDILKRRDDASLKKVADEAKAMNDALIANDAKLIKLRQDAYVAALEAAGKTEDAQIQRIRDRAQNDIAANKHGFSDLREQNGLIQQIADDEIRKIQNARSQQAQQALAYLRRPLEQAGMDQYERMFDDLKRNSLFPKDQLDEAKKIIASLKEANEAADLKKSAEALKEALLTPQQRLSKTLDEYQDMLGRGLITSDQFDLSAAKARKAILGDEPRLGNFIASGSAESLAARYDARMPKPDAQGSPQEKATRDVGKQIVAELKDVKRAVENSGSVTLNIPIS